MGDDFNYDGNDPELDENGLPVDSSSNKNSSSDSWLTDYFKNILGYDDNDEDSDDSSDNTDNSDIDDSNKKQDKQKQREQDKKIEKPDSKGETGGRYGDKTSPNKLKDNKTLTSGGKETSGKQDWFSKMFKGKGSGAAKEGAKAAKTAKNTAKAAKAGSVAAKTGGSLIAKAIAAIGPYGWLAILIIIALVIIVVAISAFVSFLAEKTNPAAMRSNEYVTSEYFYGVRTAYLDDEALSNSLELSYKQYVIDVISNFEESNPSINITITLPEENIDNADPIDTNIANLSNGIANIVATGSDNYSNIKFETLYPNIEYFGLTSSQGESVNNFIIKYITSNTLYSAPEGTNVDQLLETTLTTDTDLQYIYNRCEKVMIKDEIAGTEGITGIEQRQYIASIYMPNKNIVVNSSIYVIACEEDEFHSVSKLIEQNNGTTNIIRETETKDNSDIINGVLSGSVSLSKFASIDAENPEAFRSGLSLFDAMRLSPEYKQFFTLNEELSVYTWLPTDESMLYYTFDASKMFIYTDFDLNIQNG